MSDNKPPPVLEGVNVSVKLVAPAHVVALVAPLTVTVGADDTVTVVVFVVLSTQPAASTAVRLAVNPAAGHPPLGLLQLRVTGVPGLTADM